MTRTRCTHGITPTHPKCNDPAVTLDELLAPCLAPDGRSADNRVPNPFDLTPPGSGSSLSPLLGLVRSLTWSTGTSCMSMASLFYWDV